MTSDRGLCGGFNSNITKKAKSYFKKILDSGKELKIVTVGSKGFDQLKRAYKEHIIEKCKSEQPDLINSIVSSGKLEEENEKKLTSIILDLKKNFDK